jgi:ABC-type Fe3+ transport system substrate-binding protein
MPQACRAIFWNWKLFRAIASPSVAAVTRLLACSSRAALAASLIATSVLAPSSAPAAENRVIIITPHVDAIRAELGRAFAAWHQKRFGEPAGVDWRNVGGTSDALRFVQSEFASKSNGIGIDIFFGGGIEPYLLLSEKKFSQRYDPPAGLLDGIPQSVNGLEVYDAGHTWFGAALSSFGILQNLRVQRTVGLPRAEKWPDLAQPAVLGWVAAGDPRNSGTMTVMYECFLQFYGWERGWQTLTQLAGNARKFDRLSSGTAKEVTLGEAAYGLALDYYGFTQVAVGGRTNLSFALPSDFAPVNADGIAILRGAPHLALAQRFLEFVLSEDGQKLWCLPRGHPEGPQQFSIERMPIRPDFYRRFKGVSNIEFSPFDLKQDFRYNSRVARDRRDLMPALFGALLVDTHAELVHAWRGIIRRGLRPEEAAELGRMPLTEKQAMEMAGKAWNDPAYRNQKKIEWQSWAQAKYWNLANR